MCCSVSNTTFTAERERKRERERGREREREREIIIRLGFLKKVYDRKSVY
jgi:hypothetical protein